MELNELRKIAEAATPGPWRVHEGYYVNTVPEFDLHRFDVMSEEVAECDLRQADATHIATFDPPTSLALITELETLRRRLDAMRRQRDGYQAQARKIEQAVARVRTELGYIPESFSARIYKALDGAGRG